MWSHIKTTLRILLQKQQVESCLDDEIRSYVDALTDEKITGGLSPDEARRRALAETGGMEQVKQAVRDQRAGTFLESVIQDIRYGLRQMRRNPAFALTAVMTLGLGIGATTAIFSAVYALLIRPLPYTGSSRLMEISETWPKTDAYRSSRPLISPDLVAAQLGLRSLSIAGYEDCGNMNLTGMGDPLRVKVVGITANFLHVLQVMPAKGRDLLKGEDRMGAAAVVLLSQRLWESKFSGDAGIIGHSITIEGEARTVIGVLPAHFIFPDPAIEPDIYIPAQLSSETAITLNTQLSMMHVIARLDSGTTMQQAQAELDLFAENRAKGYPAFLEGFAKGREILVEPLQRYLTGDDREPLLILLACVGAVLLIACANVANLQLARAVARQHEMALRGALGAGRLRLMRQFLVESLTLASMAAVLGLGIAGTLTWLIGRGGISSAFSSGSYAAELLRAPMGKLSAAIQVNGWVLAFTAGLGLLTTTLFGLAPAIGASRSDLRRALQSTALRISSGRQQRRLRSTLLMMEIALAVLLLTGSGLLLRSFANVLRNASGFSPGRCLTAQIQRSDAESPDKLKDFVQGLLPRLHGIPGVQVAAVTSALPLQAIGSNSMILPGDGPVPPSATWQYGPAISISPEYFRAAGTIVQKGRPFSDGDNARSVPVAIVNRAFAQRYFQGDAIGKRVRTNIGSTRLDDLSVRTIVGVVQNVRYDGLTGKLVPVIYLPIEQVSQSSLYVLLRTTVEPGSLTSAMRKVVTLADPDQPLFDIETMDERVSQSVAQRRLMMLLISSFALLALILAGIGIYGVFTYWVSQRRQEMGIRLALGSSRRGLVRLIVMQTMRLILAGGAMGTAGAWFLDHLLANMLVGVKLHDPVSLSLAWGLMTGIALLGSCVPARNAARTDLISVLHAE